MAAPAMDDMADRYADRGVSSVFIYTREAHPGENYRHHRSMDEKRANARAFVEHSAVRRRILVDDLDEEGVYCATSKGSVYVSLDEGDSWIRIARGLAPVLSLELIAQQE